MQRKKLEFSQSAVEFALVLPLLLLVIFGMIEMGRLVFIYTAVLNASREAARYGAATGQISGVGTEQYKDCSGIANAAVKVGFLSNIKASDVTVSFDQGPGSTATSSCPPADNWVTTGTRIVITVSVPYSPIVPLVPLRPITVSSTNARTLLGSVNIEGTAPPAPTIPPYLLKTFTPTATTTATETPTRTATPTPTETVTRTPTITATWLYSPTPSQTATITPTTTSTSTSTPTPTVTPTETDKPTVTSTATNKPTVTSTITPTAICSSNYLIVNTNESDNFQQSTSATITSTVQNPSMYFINIQQITITWTSSDTTMSVANEVKMDGVLITGTTSPLQRTGITYTYTFTPTANLYNFDPGQTHVFTLVLNKASGDKIDNNSSALTITKDIAGCP